MSWIAFLPEKMEKDGGKFLLFWQVWRPVLQVWSSLRSTKHLQAILLVTTFFATYSRTRNPSLGWSCNMRNIWDSEIYSCGALRHHSLTAAVGVGVECFNLQPLQFSPKHDKCSAIVMGDSVDSPIVVVVYLRMKIGARDGGTEFLIHFKCKLYRFGRDSSVMPHQRISSCFLQFLQWCFYLTFSYICLKSVLGAFWYCILLGCRIYFLVGGLDLTGWSNNLWHTQVASTCPWVW